MKQPNKRYFEPLNQELWDTSDAAEKKTKESMQKRSVAFAEKLLPEIEKVRDFYIKTGIEHESHYSVIDKTIMFCQDPLLRSQAGIAIVMPPFYQIYGGLVTNIVRGFCKAKNIENDFKEWETYAYLHFCRLVCGDVPETIKIFEGEQDKTDIIFMASLFNHNLYKLKKNTEVFYAKNIKMLQDYGISDVEIADIQMIYKDELEHFSESVNDKAFTLRFEDWVRSVLNHKLNIFTHVKNITTDANLREWYPLAIEYISLLLCMPKLFNRYLDKNKNDLEKSYDSYTKSIYSDHRYDKTKWPNFTICLEKTLRTALNDLYKSVAYRNTQLPSNTISLDEEKDFEDEYSQSVIDRISLDAPTIDDHSLLDLELMIKDFSPQQKKIALLIGTGYQNIDIARQLGLDKTTISKYIKEMKKHIK